MFKRKKNSLQDNDFGLGQSSYPPYDESELSDAQKKQHPGCLIAIIAVFALTVGSFLLMRAARSGSTSHLSQSEPISTIPADDGVPAQVSAGLVYASYSVSGGLMGSYDIQGQRIESGPLLQAFCL